MFLPSPGQPQARLDPGPKGLPLFTSAALAEPSSLLPGCSRNSVRRGASLAVADLAESSTSTPNMEDWGELYLPGPHGRGVRAEKGAQIAVEGEVSCPGSCAAGSWPLGPH